MLLFSIVAMFLAQPLSEDHLIVFSLAAGTFLAMYFLRIKNKMIGEIIHVFILALIYSFHFNLL